MRAAATDPAGIRDRLRQPVEIPGFLGAAADLLAAAVVLVVLEWRFFVKLALAVGLPFGIYLVVFHEDVAGFSFPGTPDDLAHLLAPIVLGPLLSFFAYRKLAAHHTGEPAGSIPTLLRSRLPSLAAVTTSIQLAAGAALLPVGWMISLLGNPLLIGTIAPLVTLAVVHSAFLTAAPRALLEDVSPLGALRESWARTRPALPAIAIAYFLLLLLQAVLAYVILSPDNLLLGAMCRGSSSSHQLDSAVCWPGWRLFYVWLLQLPSAPFLALAYVVYADERTARPGGETG